MLSLDERQTSTASVSTDLTSKESRLEKSVFVLYTPDTIAKPKDLEIAILAHTNAVDGGAHETPIRQFDVFLATSANIFGAHLAAAPCFPPASLQATPLEWKISGVSGGKGDPQIKILSACGAFDRAVANQLLGREAEFLHLFDVTKAEARARGFPAAKTDLGIAVGRWPRNDAAYVINHNSSDIPLDVLYSWGAGIPLRKTNRIKLTKETFIDALLDRRSGVGLYRTNDIARFLRNVKIGSPRQIVNQVESAGHESRPRSRQSASMVIVFGECDNRPVAYSFPRNFEGLNPAQLHEHAGWTLFSYGVPLHERVASEAFCETPAAGLGKAAPASVQVPVEVPAPKQTAGTKPPLFLIPDLISDARLYRPLEYQLASERGVFEVGAPADLTKGPHPVSFKTLAQECVLDILELQKEGPFHLVGFSRGSLIAFEIASQLTEGGQEVGLLALIDGIINVPGPPIRPSEYSKIAIQNLCKVAFKFRNEVSAGPKQFVGKRLHQLSLARKVKHPRTAVPAGDELTMEQTLWLAEDAYCPQPYKGSALLLRFHDEAWTYGPDPLMGWGRVVRGGVDVVDLPGDRTSGISPARIPRLVDILQRKIVEAEDASSRKRRSAALRAAALPS